MRNLSAAILNKIQQTQGLEPINIVRVFWTDTGYIDYADRDFDTVKGQLLSLSEIEDVIDVQGNSTSTNVSVTLDASDGQIKEIFNNIDIHGRRVVILQWFADMSVRDAFSIFEGQIASPVVWQEGDRTLSFDVLSKLEDREVGFSADEASFEWVPQELVGVAWPLCFGIVNGVAGIQINRNPQGLSGESTGITDLQSNKKQITDNEFVLINLRALRESAWFFGARCYFTANSYVDKQFTANADGLDIDYSSEIQYWNEQGDQAIDTSNQYLNEYIQLLRETEQLKEQVAKDTLKKNSLNITNAQLFPQQFISTVRIGNLTYQGYFESGRFNVTKQPEIFTDDYVPTGLTTIDDRKVITQFTTQLPPTRYAFVGGGSLVQMSANYPLTYIVALNHVTVIGVQARRNGILTGVPPNYYSVQYKNFNGLLATFVQVSPPLSSRQDEGWEDSIYFTLNSNIDSNPVEIIKYIIANYTNHTYDATSFATVKTYVDKYRMGFALTSKQNVMSLLKEIAFQARCAIWFNDGKFFLKFLPQEADSIETIEEKDYDLASLTVSYTTTEQVSTKFIAYWRSTGSQEQPNRIVFRNNIDKYGTLEEGYDFFCYNIQANVEKMAEFWSIRKSNVFKRVTFRTFLHKLKIETWDTILLDFNSPLVANGSIKALVESAKFDTENNKLSVSCWVPVRAGEMTKFPFAWPNGLPVEYIYPNTNNNTTSVPASGQLVDQTTLRGTGSIVVTRARADLGRYLPIGDQWDDPNQHGDGAVTLELDNREIQPGSQPIFAPSTTNSYQVKPYNPSTPLTDTTGNNVVHGFVVSKLDGQRYKVRIFNKGLNAPSNIIEATQFSIRDDEIIPENTPVLVVISTYTRINNSTIPATTEIVREYVMQAITWVKPQNV